jgi:hypothetical protein
MLPAKSVSNLPPPKDVVCGNYYLPIATLPRRKGNSPMAIREPKLHSLKADKSFSTFKKGQEFKAFIISAGVGSGEDSAKVEMAELQLESGEKLKAPYAFFVFVEPE